MASLHSPRYSNWFDRLKMLNLALALPVLLAPVLLFSSPAAAEGPGRYRLNGVDPKSRAEYKGTVTLSQTGESTWRIVWRIGNQTWNGSGIGDGKVIAANYSGGGTTGVFLMTLKDDKKGYEAVWSYTNDTKVGTEEWRKID